MKVKAKSAAKSAKSGALQRPFPSAELFDLSALELFVPAHDVAHWLRAAFVAEGGPLTNPAHAHLRWAKIGVLWTNVPQTKQMNVVAGSAEIPTAQGNVWQRGRHDQQLREWFGIEPDFLITLDAGYATQASDLAFCALVEHELYHCAQKRDVFGAPKFTREGLPSFGIRGHDVEEFVGIIERYGAAGGAGATAQFIAAAGRAPTVGAADISGICGVCAASAH